jgi:hypothetical protein
MAVTPTSLPAGFDNAVFASQSRKWLTERFGPPPQVRLFFAEKLPGLTSVCGKFQVSEDVTPLRC